MAITTGDLQTAISRIQAGIAPVGAELNELDGKLGDGDLGVTLINGFKNISDASGDLPEDVGIALFTCAKLMTQVSGSSFGTLMATALMAAGKLVKGSTAVDLDQVPDMLQAAQVAMISRGGASLDDKTLLDSMDAIIKGLRSGNASSGMLEQAEQAAEAALAEMRDKPNRIGRARIFGDKTIGMDDPGMAAILRLLTLMRQS
jgi:dihydroxyacetone kinase-like protein